MDSTGPTITADDRAAMRAFLQRCEVRLSTAHRVATALLSGAGILVLLPALERDSVMQVLRSLLAGPVTWSRGLLAVCALASIGLFHFNRAGLYGVIANLVAIPLSSLVILPLLVLALVADALGVALVWPLVGMAVQLLVDESGAQFGRWSLRG
jgi:predicted membrane metal-binding protein